MSDEVQPGDAVALDVRRALDDARLGAGESFQVGELYIIRDRYGLERKVRFVHRPDGDASYPHAFSEFVDEE